jgi:fatty acid desaturase
MTAVATRSPELPAASQYSELMAEVRRAKLLERSAVSYVPRVLVVVTMMAAGVAALAWLGQSWWQLVVAAYLAVVFAQLGFLGHDAGHQQIFRSRRWNDRAGMLLANLGIGLSYRWWVGKHNRHHSHPNDLSYDPDVQRNVLAWTDDQASQQRGLLRVIARHQGALFFPLLTLEAINLHVGSVRMLIARPKEQLVETALLVAHVVVCSAVLLLVMSPLHALAFVGVQQALLGVYLGSSFAPNHKGMPIVDSDFHGDFLRRQVLTSRNVTAGRVLDVALGNLNYQIEHHLFPSMPSRHLRRCRPIVKRFCAAHDVAYCETTLIASYARVLHYLGNVQPSPEPPRGSAASRLFGAPPSRTPAASD